MFQTSRQIFENSNTPATTDMIAQNGYTMTSDVAKIPAKTETA
jgi:hypothetical protein